MRKITFMENKSRILKKLLEADKERNMTKFSFKSDVAAMLLALELYDDGLRYKYCPKGEA